MDPQPRGPDWMQITPKAGSLFHANSHRALRRPHQGPSVEAGEGRQTQDKTAVGILRPCGRRPRNRHRSYKRKAD